MSGIDQQMALVKALRNRARPKQSRESAQNASKNSWDYRGPKAVYSRDVVRVGTDNAAGNMERYGHFTNPRMYR